MKIKEKLELLYSYYFVTRGAGHTTLMKVGTYENPTEKFILVHNTKFRGELKCKPSELVSWNCLDKLRGAKKPLAIDNAVMLLLLKESINEICRLEQEIEKLRNKNSFFTKIKNFFKW